MSIREKFLFQKLVHKFIECRFEIAFNVTEFIFKYFKFSRVEHFEAFCKFYEIVFFAFLYFFRKRRFLFFENLYNVEHNSILLCTPLLPLSIEGEIKYCPSRTI